MKRKIKIVLCVLAALALAGCGAQGAADDMRAVQLSGENISSESGQNGSGQTGSQDHVGAETASGALNDPSQENLYMDIPEGQISEQSFQVTLDGWGEVTFASFLPEQGTFQRDGIWMYGDARFMLLKGGKAVYVFPEMYEDNGMTGQQFGQVVSAAFRDYNEDGRPDVLLILEYAGVQGIDIGTSWMEVRAYTQKAGEKTFRLDNAVSEYVNRNLPFGNPITMEDVARSLEGYADLYSAVTAVRAWEVERFAETVQTEILTGDFQSLAQKIAFPIVIDGYTYANKEAFLAADFVSVPNKVFLEAVEQASAQNLLCSWQGIMLGNGEVWFAEVSSGAGGPDGSGQGELKITAINGISGQQDGQAASGYGQQGGQGVAPGYGQQGSLADADHWQLQEEALNERMEYYRESAYYQEIVDYWENVRDVRDISNLTDYLFATDSRYYTAEDFQGEPALVIHLAKNEIYARHGYIFDDADLYNYFMGCIWYTPVTAAKDFDTSVLNAYEKENVKVLAGLDDFR